MLGTGTDHRCLIGLTLSTIGLTLSTKANYPKEKDFRKTVGKGVIYDTIIFSSLSNNVFYPLINLISVVFVIASTFNLEWPKLLFGKELKNDV